MTDDIQYQFDLPEAFREEAAMLYDEAFGAKFSAAIPNRDKRLTLL